MTEVDVSQLSLNEGAEIRIDFNHLDYAHSKPWNKFDAPTLATLLDKASSMPWTLFMGNANIGDVVGYLGQDEAGNHFYLCTEACRFENDPVAKNPMADGKLITFLVNNVEAIYKLLFEREELYRQVKALKAAIEDNLAQCVDSTDKQDSR